MVPQSSIKTSFNVLAILFAIHSDAAAMKSICRDCFHFVEHLTIHCQLTSNATALKPNVNSFFLVPKMSFDFPSVAQGFLAN